MSGNSNKDKPLTLQEIKNLSLPTHDPYAIEFYNNITNTSEPLNLEDTTASLEQQLQRNKKLRTNNNDLLHKIIYFVNNQDHAITLIKQTLQDTNIKLSLQLNDNSLLKLAIQQNKPKIVKFLLSKLDPQVKLDSVQIINLLSAVQEIIFLEELPANIPAKTAPLENKYPLHVAILLLNINPKIIDWINNLLTNEMINPNQRINYFLTPLALATEIQFSNKHIQSQLIDTLLKHPNIEIDFSASNIIKLLTTFIQPEQLQMIAELRPNNPITFTLTEKLHEKDYLDLEKISKTLENPDQVIEKFKNPAHIIEQYPLHAAIQLLKTNPNIIKLIDKLITDENINVKINNRQTPLDLAIQNKQVEVIIKLLNHPRINLTQLDCHNILKVIIMQNDKEIFTTLLTKKNFLEYILSNFDKLLKYAKKSTELKIFMNKFKELWDELKDDTSSLQSTAQFISGLQELNNNVLNTNNNIVKVLLATCAIHGKQHQKSKQHPKQAT